MRSNQDALDQQLQELQHRAFAYFQHETNPRNGLVLDKTAPDWPASIAATGLALSSYPVAVERGLMAMSAAVERTLATLRFFWESPQGPEPDATGYRGFYYHFLDMHTGRRVWQCELSTVDSAFLLAGMLTAAAYFAADTPEQREIRRLAEALYLRADWQWARERRRHDLPRLETGKRFPALPLAGLRRGPLALRARARIAESSGAKGRV